MNIENPLHPHEALQLTFELEATELRRLMLAKPGLKALPFLGNAAVAGEELRSHSGMRPHIYIASNTPANQIPSRATLGLWLLARELYTDPLQDRADLSDWLDAGFTFTLKLIPKSFILKNLRNLEVTKIVDEASNSSIPLGLASFGELS